MTFAVVRESLEDPEYLLELGELPDIAGLTPSDGAFIVGDGSAWVAESGATARASLGLGTMATQNAGSVAITGGTISGITDLAVADGGTGASSASAARTNLGLGTIATQAASNVAITGGAINGTTIGASTPASASFTQTDWGFYSGTGATDGKRMDPSGYILRSSRAGVSTQTHHSFVDASGAAGFIQTNGSGSTSYLTTSDERLKSEPSDGQTDFESGVLLDAVGIQRYEMFGNIVRGFRSAQELHAVFPEAVAPGQGEPGEPDFVPWTVDYSKLVPLIIRELQRLRERERQAVQAYQNILGRVISLENARTNMIAALQTANTRITALEMEVAELRG